MLEEKYRKAYDSVKPSQELLNRTIQEALYAAKQRRAVKVKTAAAAAAVCLCFAVSLPVCARHIPAFYKVLESISPRLADRLVPIERSSISRGIVMEVEGIHLEGGKAEILVSFRDEEGSGQDLINGEADISRSFGLADYLGEGTIGGCSYLTYDDETGKAYFKADIQKAGTQSVSEFQGDKLTFSVNGILCGIISEQRSIDLSGCADSAALKSVPVSGRSGSLDPLPEVLQGQRGNSEDPRPSHRVLDMTEISRCAGDDFTMTGIAYMDGVLRVQICMGDNMHANRHVQPFLTDGEGNERHEDYSVSWSEDVGDTRYQFYEYWFVEEIGDLGEYSMYGIFHDSGEYVQGDWSVTFRVGAVTLYG